MASSIEMWNNAELTSLEEWRVPSPSAVYQPELFGAGYVGLCIFGVCH